MEFEFIESSKLDFPLYQPDDILARLVGSQPIKLVDVTTKLWEHIKANKLQNPEKRIEINADDVLLPIFGGKKQVSKFDLIDLVVVHLTPIKK